MYDKFSREYFIRLFELINNGIVLNGLCKQNQIILILGDNNL